MVALVHRIHPHLRQSRQDLRCCIGRHHNHCCPAGPDTIAASDSKGFHQQWTGSDVRHGTFARHGTSAWAYLRSLTPLPKERAR